MEIFTGKNKIQFELYVLNNYDAGHDPDGRLTIRLSNRIVQFYKLPPEMQQGVILAYADSLGLEICVESDYRNLRGEKEWVYTIEEDMVGKGMGGYSDRPEAYKAAFKKFDELINEKLNKG